MKGHHGSLTVANNEKMSFTTLTVYSQTSCCGKRNVRSINQEEAKQDALKSEDPQSAILIMDWAMKFLQIKFREKQSEWFGKRGLSWHISTLITKNVDSGKIELKSYTLIFHSCQQDWYAVCSIIENTLEVVKKEHLQIT